MYTIFSFFRHGHASLLASLSASVEPPRFKARASISPQKRSGRWMTWGWLEGLVLGRRRVGVWGKNDNNLVVFGFGFNNLCYISLKNRHNLP